MISCPDCQAENEAGAKICHACGKELPVAAPVGELPLWLQALKPDHLKESEADPEVNEPLAEESPALTIVSESVVASSPVPEVPIAAYAEHDGTDRLVATQPTPAARPVEADPVSLDDPIPAQSPAKVSSGTNNETASLINEDDLPAWLRAFSENDTSNKTPGPDDQSWMLGGTGEGSADTVAENLAQSWQAPTHLATAQRASAVSVFTTPAENGAKVEKSERVLIAPAPPVAPEPVTSTSAPVAKAGTLAPTRLPITRPAPATRERSGMSVQRIAVIAFLVALVIFLIVLGIFIVGPTLTK